MPSDTFPFMSQILFQRRDLIKTQNPVKFLEYSLCSSHFTDSQKLALGQHSILSYFEWFFIDYLLPSDEIKFLQNFYQ